MCTIQCTVCSIKCAVDRVQCRQFFWWYTGQISAVDAPISINCKGRFKTTFKTTYKIVYIHDNRVQFNKSVCWHYFWINLSGRIESPSVKTTVFSSTMNESVTIGFSSLNWNTNREQREIWNDSREKSWNVILLKHGDREPVIPFYYNNLEGRPAFRAFLLAMEKDNYFTQTFFVPKFILPNKNAKNCQMNNLKNLWKLPKLLYLSQKEGNIIMTHSFQKKQGAYILPEQHKFHTNIVRMFIPFSISAFSRALLELSALS